MQKECLVCKNIYFKKPTESVDSWSCRKYCCHTCYWIALKDERLYRESRIKSSQSHMGNPGYWKGKKRPEFDKEWKRNMSRNPWNKGKVLPQLSGENSPNWKGDSAGYHSIHIWVSKNLGKPSHCAKCDKSEGKFEWANISKEYKRDLSDWVRLCKSCHNIYDDVYKKIWDSRRSS